MHTTKNPSWKMRSTNISRTLRYGLPYPSQTTRPSDRQQKTKTKKANLSNSGAADYEVKLKESEKRDKYLDLAKELKNYGT